MFWLDDNLLTNSSVFDETKWYDSSSIDSIDYKPSSKYPITLKIAKERALRVIKKERIRRVIGI